MIKKTGQEGFAIDDEEYLAGIRALAAPLHHPDGKLEAAIWIVGLKSQIRVEDLPSFKSLLKQIVKKIEIRFGMS